MDKMMTYSKLSKTNLFRTFTGLRTGKFDRLYAIGRMKRFRIIGEEFRNRLTRYDAMTSIISGLVNFQLMIEKGFELSGFVG